MVPRDVVQLELVPSNVEGVPEALPAFHCWYTSSGEVWTSFHRHPQGYLIRFPSLADFLVSTDGRMVRALPAADTDAATVEHLYLNQVLPLALSRQHRLVVHASAVALNGVALAFMGNSGRGKSTLATHLLTAGGQLLTDDGLQLQWQEERLWVLPSHPSVRLWADSRQAIAPEHSLTAAPLGYTDKTRLLAGTDLPYCDTPRPLARVYVLGDGSADTPTIRAMKAAEAVAELAKNTFLLDFEELEMKIWHFEALQDVAVLPVFFHLDYPRRFDALPDVFATIQQHTLREPA